MVARDASAVDAERLSRSLLPRVSRTFALGIKLLPSKLEPPVRLGYLLCRIADTIEDDLALPPTRKAELLDAFLHCFDDAREADAFGPAAAGTLTANPDYLELVEANGAVFQIYRGLDAPTQAILRRWVEEMVAGMRSFVLARTGGIRVATFHEFERYCYYVAGTVGHLLTDLWHEHSPLIGKKTYERLLEDAEAFGEALQTVNILKDVAWDAQQEDAVYVPAQLLAAAGSSQEHILDPHQRAANRRAIEPLIALAQANVERSLRYIEAIPAAAFRIRLFCVFPILFAIATLREIASTDVMFVPGESVKISRDEVKAIIVAASTSALTNLTLRRLADRIRKKPFVFPGR